LESVDVVWGEAKLAGGGEVCRRDGQTLFEDAGKGTSVPNFKRPKRSTGMEED